MANELVLGGNIGALWIIAAIGLAIWNIIYPGDPFPSGIALYAIMAGVGLTMMMSKK